LDGSSDVFVHFQDIEKEGYKSLGIGESVEFDEHLDEFERRRATKVTGPKGAPVQGYIHPREAPTGPRDYDHSGGGGGGGGYQGGRSY
jgi:cold shock CspA family protein